MADFSSLKPSSTANPLEKYMYTPRITTVDYYVLGDEETQQDACIQITNKEIFKGDRPEANGIYDPHMGTTDIKWECRTCGNKKNVCPGHPGELKLRYPVKSPVFREEIFKWLKILCFKCGRLLTTTVLSGLQSRMLNEYVRLCSKKVKHCPHDDCKAIRYVVVKDKDRAFTFNIETEISQNEVLKQELYNHEIRAIFARVSEETVRRVAPTPDAHPMKLIVSSLRVPPNTIRPDIRRIGGSSNRSNNSDITAFIKNIVEINEKLPQILPPKKDIDMNLKNQFNLLELLYSDMVKGSTKASTIRMTTNTNKTPTSLADRHKNKTGRVRGNLMGKRVFFAARSVITGDNYLRVDEVGVPLNVAKALQIPEIVNPTNHNRLMLYFKNAKAIYPGCSGIKKRGSDLFYAIDYFDKNYVLQDGDTVYRDLVDGDNVLMNRPPSLLFSSISGHRVRVLEKGLTFRINVSACKFYNADFDGDAMTMLVAQNIQSRIEIERMSWVGNWFVSYQNHAPMCGAVQDALLGISLLTQSNVRIDKYHGMQLLGHIDPVSRRYDFSKPNFTGREVVSMFLPEVNYPEKKAKMYMPQYADFINYKPDEIKVKITRGKIESGILDSNSVGQGKIGSLYHVIKSEFGAEEALLSIFNTHQAIGRYLMHRGFTIGIRDIHISQETTDKIKDAIAQNLANATDMIEQLNRRKLIAPYGISLSEFFEEQQLKILEEGDAFVRLIFKEIQLEKNNLAWIIFIGSKGKINNFVSINAAIGSQTVYGRRMPRNYGNGRTSPYFLRYDLDPRSLGYVENSFREGIDPSIYPFAVAESRLGSVNNQLSTPVTGAQNRLNVKNLETIMISIMRMAVKKRNVVQLLYSENGVDPRRTELVKFRTVTISDEEFKTSYHAKAGMFDATFDAAAVQKELDAEFEQLAADRQVYREVFFQVESSNLGVFIFKDDMQLPVNPFRIIENTLQNNAEKIALFSKEEQMLDPIRSIHKVKELCASLGYAYFNHIQEERKMVIPEYIQTTLMLLRIAIRSYFCTANLVRKGVNNRLLDLIIQKVKFTLKNALIDYGTAVGIIAAQCLSEPLTQYALNSKNRTGGGGGSKSTTIERTTEILGARPTKNMKNPSMIIMTKPEFEQNKAKVQEIANYIEMMEFQRFVSVSQIFYETYGEPVHPKYAHERELIATFQKCNMGLQCPPLSKWCLRFELNKEELITNSMKLETIVIMLRLKFPKTFVVYSPEKKAKIVMRMYLATSMLKPNMGYDLAYVRGVMSKVLGTVIRGVRGIINTSVYQMVKSFREPDGSIKSAQVYAIQTTGTNLEEVLENPYVDPYRTQTDSIKEFEEVYGIDATRNKIISELARIMNSDDVVRMHSTIFADEMTFSGTVTSILKTGLGIREKNNVSLRASFQAPNMVLHDAAAEHIRERNIDGISGPFLFGQTPRLGTTFSDVSINAKFVEDYHTNLHRNIEDEL